MLVSASNALANGQSSHLWITEDARSSLSTPDLVEALDDPAVLAALRNGTMFPDGGYAVDDDYGEIAHWEPFLDLYIDWVREEYAVPFDDEGRRHAAFALGLASHGMADQVFDALYLERSRRFDAENGWAAGKSMDEATDVAFVAAVGPVTQPELDIPSEALVQRFATYGHDVSASTLETGQDRLGIAIWFVEQAAARPESVAEYEALFPWATANQQEGAVPGTPKFIGPIVARYMERVWARLNGRSTAEFGDLLGSVPTRGQPLLGHATDDMSGWVTLVFARGLRADGFDETPFRWVTDGGDEVEFSAQLYYRDNSHVVHLIPAGDLPTTTGFVVTVDGELPFRDGGGLQQPIRLEYPVEEAEETRRCGCGEVQGGLGWLVPLALLAPLFRRRKRHLPDA